MARPRDPEVDRKIIGAAARLLREGGYAAVSMAAVAEAAGVGKPALYRRYPSRAELVFAATIESSLMPGAPDSGGFAEDMRLAVAELVRTLRLAPRELLADQMGRAMADATFSRALRERQLDPSIEVMLQVWDRGVARGEVDARLDGRRALRDLSSAVIMRVMLFHEEMEEPFQQELLTRFLRAVAPGIEPPERA